MDIGTPGEAATTEAASTSRDDFLQASSRKRCRIREMLEQSRQKRQQLNDTVDIHEQLREVTSGLAPGQRVYVRYEYDDLIEIEDGATQPQIIDAKMVWWPAQLAIYSPLAHLNRPSQAIVSSEPKDSAVSAPSTVPTSLPPEPEPAAIVEDSRQYTAEEVFNELKDELTEEDKRIMVELMKTHAHKIVYTLDYEGREAFSPESIPCFFIDQDNLMHLHKCWGAAVYRTESNIGEVNLEEPLQDGVDAIATFFDGLTAGMEDAISSLDEMGERVFKILTGIKRHADQVGCRHMTANDVCDYFAQQPEMTIVFTRLNGRAEVVSDELEDDEEPEALDALSSDLDAPGEHCSSPLLDCPGASVTSAACADNNLSSTPSPQLQDNPFPRR